MQLATQITWCRQKIILFEYLNINFVFKCSGAVNQYNCNHHKLLTSMLVELAIISFIKANTVKVLMLQKFSGKSHQLKSTQIEMILCMHT